MTGFTFCELGVRSNFSFLEGASKPEELVATAKAIGLSGIGIADRNTVAGVVRAYSMAKTMGTAFRPGARLCFSDDTPDILAYPRDRRGWGRLCRLLSTGNLRSGKKGVCTLYLSDLCEWQEGLLLVVMPKRSSEDPESLRPLLARLAALAGDRLHLGLTPHYDGRDRFVFATFASIAGETGVPLLATNDVLYHAADRRSLADVVTAIREHVTIETAGYRLQPNAERFLKPAKDMLDLFRAYPQAVSNAAAFFSRLHFDLLELKHHYPDEAEEGETPAQTLRRLVYEGATKRYPGKIPVKVRRAIAYELKLIHKKRYEPYFLTVHKIVNFARNAKIGILCQGRGSAANSSVCYCLGITEVDPQRFTLLFDRFLSEDRDEPPDIDVDFEHARREEVIQFIYETYGIRHAGLTAAVISYRPRSAGREVAKALGFSQDVQDALSSSIWGWWTEAFSDEQARGAGLDKQNPMTVHLLKQAERLLGFPRHLSQHVGGFVITHDRLDEVVPIMPTAMPKRYMIEWDKDDLDTLKILKVDVLALGMLTCLAKALKLLETHYGKRKTLAAIYEEEKADDPVYDMICRADTLGVFQVESRAQMSMLPRLRPREFYDLVIEVAIVRPGPIQGNMVHPYLKRREQVRDGKKAVDYPSPELEEVLKRTLGVPLFQEQAMQIAITAAGFTANEADRLRRAMATFKRTGTIESFEKRMVEGMVAKNYDRDFAQRCFEQIKGFGEYGFPESHAASFALLVYASSWFKTYYPDVFCAAILNSQPMGFYAPAQLVRDAREHGVRVLPVDVNHSDWDCTLEGEDAFDPEEITSRHASMRDVIRTKSAVRLGFRLAKGLGEADIRDRLVERRGTGYVSVRDLWLRSGLPRSVVERLADADAFRSIGLDRRQALWEAKALDERSAAERLPLFAHAGGADAWLEPPMRLPEMPEGEQVVNDYRYLTLSLKAHPVSFMRATFARQGVVPNASLADRAGGRRVCVAGLVLVRQRPGSAKGVIFMTIEDETGIANAIVWNNVLARYRAVILGARLVKIHGKLQNESGVIHVVVDHVEDMTEMLGILKSETRSFGAMSRADEVLHPAQEHRFGGAQRGQNDRQASAELRETARVLPKGRNFH